jgi:hypothetical protein
MPSPIKRAFPDYRAAEKRLWAVIAERFNVPVEMHPFVLEADARMCTTEKVALLTKDLAVPQWAGFARDFPPYVGDWDIVERPSNFPPTHSMIRRRFLDFYETVREA